MRIKVHKEGEIRFVDKFLWLPLRSKEEIRWLEFARCKYEYVYIHENIGKWYFSEFVNE